MTQPRIQALLSNVYGHGDSINEAALLLGQLADPRQAVACYNLVEERYSDAPEPELKVIVNTAVALQTQLNRGQ